MPKHPSDSSPPPPSQTPSVKSSRDSPLQSVADRTGFEPKLSACPGRAACPASSALRLRSPGGARSHGVDGIFKVCTRTGNGVLVRRLDSDLPPLDAVLAVFPVLASPVSKETGLLPS